MTRPPDGTSGDRSGTGRRGARRGPVAARVAVPLVSAAAWLALWGLTPGLLANGVGSLLTDDPSAQVLIESALALAVLLVLSAVFARATREAFAPTRLRWAYALPLVLVAVLPLHYDLDLPVGVYLA